MTSVSARKGSPRTKWYVLLFIFIVAVVVFYISNDSAPAQQQDTSVTDHQTSQNTAPERGTGAAADQSPDSDNFSFAYCEGLLTDTGKASRDWGRANHGHWGRYVDMGYSLDEVTLVVEHFTNPNFAASFRARELRKYTEVNQTLSELEAELTHQFPDFRDSGIRLTARIPAPALEDYVEKSSQERATLLQEHGISADDVAYFIGQHELSDDDIILLAEQAADIFAPVNYERLETTSLLNYAVAETRPRMVAYLLNAGLRPAADSYLGSTMEWALSRLSYNSGDRQQQAANIISMLLTYDAPARFDIKNERRVEGSFPQNGYRFDEQEINAIQRDYGIDLTRIADRQVPSVSADHRLIRELEAQRTEHLHANIHAQNLDADLASCEQVVALVREQWQPQFMHNVLNRVVAEYPDSPERAKSELARIDPSLVDAFRERYEGRLQRFAPVDMPQEIRDLLDQGKIDEVIQFYSKQELSDANINTLMWNILSWDVSHYETLRHSGLLREPLEYSDMKFFGGTLSAEPIEKLELAGADMRSADSRQKTLLFYAVEQARSELVTILVQRGYPFTFDDLGQDPLHAVLDTTNYRLSMEIVEALLPVLMEYRPDIDEFHLSRMAVIQLKYPQTYHSLISQYPELEVQPDTELPRVR